MNTETVYSIVQELDYQISQVEKHKLNKTAVEHLLDLRNRLITKYMPDPNVNWTIRNKKALGVINFFNFELQWTQRN